MKKASRAKEESGLAPEDEPQWYTIINPILAETNEAMKLTSSALETSFLNNHDSSTSEEDEECDDHQNNDDQQSDSDDAQPEK